MSERASERHTSATQHTRRMQRESPQIKCSLRRTFQTPVGSEARRGAIADSSSTASAMTATTEKELAQAAAEWEREERPRRACGGALLALPFFVLAVLLLNPSLGEEPADAGDRTVLLHVIPSKDLLLSRPFGEQAPTLSTSREQFAKLFAAQHSAVAFVGPLDAIDAPQDVAPNLRVDGHAATPASSGQPHHQRRDLFRSGVCG